MGFFDYLKGNTKNKANIVTNCNPPEFDSYDLPVEIDIPCVRDQLVLLLISETRMNNPRTLGLQLDRCDFPGNESKSVSKLVSCGLVYFSQVNGFGHPLKYAVTDVGKEFLKNHIDYDEVISHIKQMSNPNFMLELVQAIFIRKQSEQ